MKKQNVTCVHVSAESPHAPTPFITREERVKLNAELQHQDGTMQPAQAIESREVSAPGVAHLGQIELRPRVKARTRKKHRH